MKIHEFAEKNAISVRTVRYYVQIELLSPGKTGGQMDFSEMEFARLKKIEEMKEAGYQLKEIAEWFSWEDTPDEEGKKGRRLLAKRVLERLKGEEEKLRIAIGELEKEIHNIAAAGLKSKKGIPAELLSILCCPICRRKLRYEHAVITGTELWEADISCECGYHAEIRDGVFLSQEQREEKRIVPIDMNRETYSRLKPEGISRLQKNFYWILKQLKSQKLGGKIVFENFVNTICFLSTGLPYLDREAFYVIADSDERVIRDIKQRIEGLGCTHKILFLVQNSMNYPLKEGAIDFVIDYFHSEIVQSFGFPTLEMEMRPYVRCGSEIVGIYTYAKEGKKTLARTREMFPDSWEGRFILKEFQKNFKQCGVKIEEEKYGGTLTDSVIESYEKGDIFGEWCFRAKYQ